MYFTQEFINNVIFDSSLRQAQGKQSVSVDPESVEGSKEGFMVLFDTFYSLKLGS